MRARYARGESACIDPLLRGVFLRAVYAAAAVQEAVFAQRLAFTFVAVRPRARAARQALQRQHGTPRAQWRW